VVGTSDLAVRSLSGIFAVTALVPMWILARRRGGRDLALVAVAMLALSPFAVRYATEARMYSLVMLEVLVAAVLIDELLDDVERSAMARRVRLGLVALLSGALALTHYWGIFVVLASVAVLVVAAWLAGDADQRRRRTTVAGALALGGLLFVPWLGAFVYQAGHTGTPWAPPSRPGALVGVTLRDLAAGDVDEAALGVAVFGALLLLGLGGRAVDRHRVEVDVRTRSTVRGEAAVVAVTFVMAAAVSFVAGSAFSSRYAAVVAPFVVLIAAAGVVTLTDRWFRLGVLVVVFAVAGAGIADQLTTERTQAGQIAAAIRTTLAEPGAGTTKQATVLYCPDQLGPAGSRALNGPPALGRGADEPLLAPADVGERVYPTDAPPGLVDWVDYAARNATADPSAFAQQILARQPVDGSIFLVWDPAYDTFEGQCEGLRAGLAAARPGAVDVVANDPDGAFEHAALTWFPPVAP